MTHASLNAPDSTDAARWLKSSHSGGSNGSCVEFARNLPGLIPVRDSKNPAGATLALSPESWRGFVSALAAGHFRV